jgi:hypothetical protein
MSEGLGFFRKIIVRFEHILPDTAFRTLQTAIFAFQFAFTLAEYLRYEFFLAYLVKFQQAGGGTSAGLPENGNDLTVSEFMLDMSPGSHISRLFLHPQGLQNIRVFFNDIFNLRSRKGMQLLQSYQRNIPGIEFFLAGEKVVIYFSRTEYEPADLFYIHIMIIDYFPEAAIDQFIKC